MTYHKRNLVLCAEDTEAASRACKWLLESVREWLESILVFGFCDSESGACA